MQQIMGIKTFIWRLFQSIISIFRIVLFSKKTKLINVLKTSTDCIIIGNGPSLKNTIVNHRNFFAEKQLLAVNHFAISEYYEQLKPEFYLAIAHDLYYDDVNPEFIEASNRLFNTMAEKTSWEITLFMPFEAKKYLRWQTILNKNKNIQIKYINLTPADGFNSLTHWLFKKNLAMPRPHNVMIPSLIIGINLDFKTIYLVGAEHSWLKDITVNDNNQALIHNKHFYDTNTSKAKAFDKKGKGARNLPEILFTLMTTFNSYFVIKNYAEKQSVRIINCTEGSYIDAFERKKLNNE
jgi:hypothetical protein